MVIEEILQAIDYKAELGTIHYMNVVRYSISKNIFIEVEETFSRIRVKEVSYIRDNDEYHHSEYTYPKNYNSHVFLIRKIDNFLKKNLGVRYDA